MVYSFAYFIQNPFFSTFSTEEERMAEQYTAKNIQVLEGLEHIRKRPGMYIGSTDVRGLNHILYEIIDNSMDEAANGYANRVDVTINEDGSATVEDNGRGIPVDMHAKGVPAVQVIFTVPNSGGKFSGENYAVSSGLHGVGASVTNALSEWVEVEIYRDKKIYKIDFHSGMVDGKFRCGEVKEPLRVVGKTDKRGTKVTFKPDPTVFDTVDFDQEILLTRLREYAFLNKNVLLTFTDRRTISENNPDGDRVEFRYEKGLMDFVSYINKDAENVNKMMYFEGEKDGIRVKVAIQHNDGIYEKFYSYVNGAKTDEGGTHVTGFKTAFTRCMNDFAKSTNAFKGKDIKLEGDDFKEGLTAVLLVQMRDAQFEGQTKRKLGNQSAKTAVDGVISEKLSEFLANPKNKAIGDYIVKKAMEVSAVREASRKAAQIERQKNTITGMALIGKFASCTGKNPVQNELFIVEGDSAGGSAKQGRDRKTQAVLPLRGKPLNVLKGKKEKIYENEEIRTIIAALGTGIGANFKIEDLKFHKIIILSDADYDGYHIRTLLLSFFYKLMPELIYEGKVFVGMPPLYKVEKKGKIAYAYDDAELDKVVEEMKGFSGEMHIQRYKGLGEMNKDQLWDTTLNPRTRLLTKVVIEDAMEADDLIDIMMTEGAEKRKEYIFRYAKFNRIDNFAVKYGGKD